MHSFASSVPVRRRGAIAVIVRDRRLLVIRRSASVVAPGAVCFPGGGIEADETEEQALVREFREELGAPVAPLRRLWQSVTRWEVELSWWLAHLEADAELAANPAEVASFHWLTHQEILAESKLLESNRQFLALVAAGDIRLDR